ncbi:hypothetical protein SAMN04515671_4385 [Nakamurella panacisegetis]|uniref:Uncharacterized protein n=1 Tax=Nakamurella panacisegetis TaxID=1090615 RepID=A0A1H0T045_9ACTN|nr:hypothetical protein [Nakamurella panacisegetis]SDP47329.1 hypothetical protein SAMN04515671_4385 [Nakamurella panacisegetis]
MNEPVVRATRRYSRSEETTPVRLRRSVPLLVLLMALLTMAGCSVDGSAARGASDPAPTFDTSPSAVVFAVGNLAPYNPSNQQASNGFEIHGDGTVTGDKVALGKKVPNEQLQQLARRADELGLLDQPDLGYPVYDAGELDLHLTLNGKTVNLSVTPSEVGSYSKAQSAARQAVRDFAELLRQAIA